MHGTAFEVKDLLVIDGRFHLDPLGNGADVETLDAGGRIVIPGGILPSFTVPIPTMRAIPFDPVASARALLQAGFTTIIVDGLSPFTALDVHQQLQRMPLVTKIPIIDVANFQLLLGFLKNGVGNHAAAVLGSLIARFKGFGISCIGPGSTLAWSSSQQDVPRSIHDPLPFLNIDIGKIMLELAASHDRGSFKSSIFMQTGIEGIPGSRQQLDGLVASLHGRLEARGTATGTGVAIALKQLSRLALDPGYNEGDIAANVSTVLKAMVDAPSVGGLLDLPSLAFSSTTFVDFAASPLRDARHLLARGIVEGELAVTAYRIGEKSLQDLATRFWLAGMKLALELPDGLEDRVAFSLMPGLIIDPTGLVDSMACLLSEAYRCSHRMPFHDEGARAMARDVLGVKTLTLPGLVHMTRVVPARILGLEGLVGGLGAGQLGDAIVLNAREGDLDALRDKPDALRAMLDTPHAVIKGGTIIIKDGKMLANERGFTILHEVPVDPSISASIEQGIDKQFLKYYSTNIDAKAVPASLVEPMIKA